MISHSPFISPPSILSARSQLRDREREAEKSNAVLLATEETIDSLERDVKDKEAAAKTLAAELKDKDLLLRVSPQPPSLSIRLLSASGESSNAVPVYPSAV